VLRSSLRATRAQASVELVALLPALAVVAVLAWQLVVAGHAMWMVANAARAAARAHALGRDELRAARATLPARLRVGLSVRDSERGAVTVRVGVPAVVGSGRLLTVAATAGFVGQGS
jgi:thiamine monophosphate synthase